MTRIKNDLQLAATKKWIAEFDQALVLAKRDSKGLHPRLRQAHVDGIRSQIADLKSEVEEYEAIRSKDPGGIAVESLEELPEALVRVRIARHLTQEQLAARIGVTPQQVQKWEASAYRSAKYSTVLKVASALKIEMAGAPAS